MKIHNPPIIVILIIVITCIICVTHIVSVQYYDGYYHTDLPDSGKITLPLVYAESLQAKFDLLNYLSGVPDSLKEMVDSLIKYGEYDFTVRTKEYKVKEYTVK